MKIASSFGCNTFIGVGSQAEYGRYEGLLAPQTPAFPENGYGIAKLCAGQLSRILCSQMGMRHIWVRVLSVFGPYDSQNSLIISTLNKMIINEEIIPFTLGEQIWDFLYCYDAARALYLLYEKGIDEKVYVLGSGKPNILKNYIEIIKRITDSSSILDFGGIPYSDKQVMHLCADISELTNDTGFEPKFDFEDGILDTLKYLKNN